jgi:hypothetical protein
MIAELIHNALQSTPQGYVGVSAIWIYMGVIIVVALYRIKKGDHLEHH